MKKTLLLLGLLFLGPLPPIAAAGPEDAVVRVLATQQMPSPFRPWANGTPNEVMGSGTVIDGKRILTSAHIVLYAKEISVQPHRGGDKVDAKVVMVAPDMDVAVLSVEDAKFFDKHPPLPRDKKLPKATDNV